MRTPGGVLGLEEKGNEGSLGERRGPEHLCGQGNAGLAQRPGPSPGHSAAVPGAELVPKAHAIHTYSAQG